MDYEVLKGSKKETHPVPMASKYAYLTELWPDASDNSCSADKGLTRCAYV